jgi:glyoxylase-like metal-dependent hydrolase (beta-lactamase superfamily II)
VLETITRRSLQVLEMLQPEPVLTRVRDGEHICVGGEAYNIHWVAGHSDGHMLLHRVRDGLLFLGDQVLLKITPNIGLWPLLDPNPLQSYLTSLETLAALDVSLALPGHRALIHDLAGRISEIKHHHELRLQACLHAAGEGATGYEVCLHIFPRLLNADDIRMGMVEALSHLEYLASQQRLERLDGEVIRYRRRAPRED